MKGKAKIIELLNEVLTAELTAINQYIVHSEMCENWGYKRLGEVVRKQAIDEMKHAEKLIERILYLEGLPNVQRLGKIKIGQTVPEQLKLDWGLEDEAIKRLNEALPLVVELKDGGTRELLEDILVDEEEHADWLEAQIDQIEQVGEQNYLAQQIRS
jgi:bacterioferritin